MPASSRHPAGAPDRIADRLSLRIQSSLMAPIQARRWVRRLGDLIPEAALERAELLISELITNSVKHAGMGSQDRVDLCLEIRPDRLRVEVHDPGRGFEPGLPPRPREGSGWGLLLVDELSDRWGIERANGTLAWFELDLAGRRTLRAG